MYITRTLSIIADTRLKGKRERTKGEPTPQRITDMKVKGSTPRFCVSFGEHWLKFEELTNDEIAMVSKSTNEKRSCWEGFDLDHTPRARFTSDCRVSSCEGSAMCDNELYMLATVELWVEAKGLKDLPKAVYQLIAVYSRSMDWTKLRASQDHRSIELRENHDIESSSEGAPALPIN